MVCDRLSQIMGIKDDANFVKSNAAKYAAHFVLKCSHLQL